MGRQPSITLDDVRIAQEQLVAADKPHGIIAIRRQIGRGSPQLISRFLDELNESNNTFSVTKVPSRRAQETSVSKAWETISSQIESLLANDKPKQKDVLVTQSFHPSKYQDERLDRLEALVKQQRQHLARIESLNQSLEEKLMQQQDLFDSWRHEQYADRQLLKTQLDHLTQLATNKPARKRGKRAEQLDLYDDSAN